MEESVLGWKEYEMEVVRDQADNCVIVCSIENVDPMGIHAGDSITVAPALTLTDKEYQIMRNASIAVLPGKSVSIPVAQTFSSPSIRKRTISVIEMNPRVSRSSAWPQKPPDFRSLRSSEARGGLHADELNNDITDVTPASFEPTIDYVVTKIPRFTFIS